MKKSIIFFFIFIGQFSFAQSILLEPGKQGLNNLNALWKLDNFVLYQNIIFRFPFLKFIAMKKILFLIVLVSVGIQKIKAQSILISPNNGSKLIETNATNKAVQMPSVSATSAITSPQKGMVVFDDATGTLSYFNGSQWVGLSNSTTGWAVNANTLSNTNSGNVGIGTPSPASKLHTFVGDAGAVSPRTGTIGTFETNSSTGYLSILTPNTAQSGVAFGSPDGNADGSINFNHLTQKLTLNTKASTRMTIDSLGNIGIADTSPEVRLDVNGAVHIQKDLLLRERLLQPSSSASYDPFDRQDKSFVTIEPSTNVTSTIKGFSVPTTSATFGTLLYVSNGSTGSIVLKHDDSTVTNNRIITNTGADVTISGRGGAILIYDFTGWRLIAFAE
jgi:hypothetical protein